MPRQPGFKTALAAFLALFSCLAAFAEQGGKVQLELFHQAGCKECELVKSLVLPGLEERFGGEFELRLLETGEKANFLRLLEYQEKLKIEANEPVALIVDGQRALCGYKEIAEKAQGFLADALAERAAASPAKGGNAPPPDEGLLKRRAGRMTVAAVALAGLLDGLNPCAFSTLVFLLSVLAAAKVRDGRLLAVGLSYCLASFLCYTLLGLGVFKLLKAMNSFQLFQSAFNWAMAALLLLLALLSFRDAWLYRKTGEGGKLLLRLPTALKTLVNAILKRGLSYRWLVPGAFLAGLAVTLLESVCTGQVYLPTLALLAKEAEEPWRWLSLLLLYNALFALPLLTLFALVYSGARTPQLLAWSRRNVAPSKILLGLLFLALAALILWL